MRRQAFIAAHRATWQRLSDLLDRVERSGVQSLSPSELEELGRAYLHASSHLSTAATAAADPSLVSYLNRLLTRAYVRIYSRGRSPVRTRTVQFATGIPGAFRRRAGYIAVSALLSLAMAVLGFWAVRMDPRWGGALVRGDAVERWETFARHATSAGEYFADTARSAGGPELSMLLMSNNVRVAVNAFALGVTLGLGTLLVLSLNALMVGAFLAVGAGAGRGALFVSVIAPHGVLELSAIAVAGGAGLLVGHAILDPGDRPRREAFRAAALEAGQLFVATVPMFILAAVIEGIISPQVNGLFAHDGARVAFGLTVAAAAYLLLFYGDRLRPRRGPQDGIEAPHPPDAASHTHAG